MGRGLSPLQNKILDLACARAPGKLYLYEILWHVYGFSEQATVPKARTYDNKVVSGHRFSEADIGTKTYHAAYSAASRAVRRLEDRGLVKRVWGAYSQWSALYLVDKYVESADMG